MDAWLCLTHGPSSVSRPLGDIHQLPALLGLLSNPGHHLQSSPPLRNIRLCTASGPEKYSFFCCSAESAWESGWTVASVKELLWREELLSKTWQAQPSPCCGFPVTGWGPEMLNNRASVARPLPSLLEVTPKKLQFCFRNQAAPELI